ncbi:hypothetical protein ACOME3_002274 [Neoechinorhynchus agilis]
MERLSSHGAPGKYWFGILPAPTRSQHPTYGMPPQRREQSPASARKRSGRSTPRSMGINIFSSRLRWKHWDVSAKKPIISSHDWEGR